jgi:hypothetical protein
MNPPAFDESTKISLNGYIIELKLSKFPFSFSRAEEKKEVIYLCYKRMNIAIDPDGYLWVRENDEEEVLSNLSFNTLTSFLRTDYKRWCILNDTQFINAEFKRIFDKLIMDVFCHTKYLYAHPEVANKMGALKEEFMDSKKRL